MNSKGMKAVNLNTAVDSGLDNDTVLNLSGFFKIFSDATRLKILFALMDKTLRVSDIADSVGVGSTVASHQLKTLKDANMIKSERVGKCIYYSIVGCHVRDIVEMALAHISEK